MGNELNSVLQALGGSKPSGNGFVDRIEQKVLRVVEEMDPIRLNGKVDQVIGLVVESSGPAASMGDLCRIENRSGKFLGEMEVVGFRGAKTLLMPLGTLEGVGPGSMVTTSGNPISVGVGPGLLGRVLDGLGRPMDGLGLVDTEERRSIYNAPPDPLSRARIASPLITRIRAIDAFATCGKGQRMGLFAGSGVGKSVLLGMIARHSEADVNVIALVGERGREVREFIEKDLQEGLGRSVVVAATSDKAALTRVKAALVATTIAEYFRDAGADVMLMMDSLTRVAMAQREIGLAVGEPPTTKGYTPSVFALLPKLLERAGATKRGSITGLYTVLVEGDDTNEPIADAARAILDGHIVLSRRLATQGHYPAMDVLESISRVMIDVVDEKHLTASRILRELLATYRESEDLIHIGAYVKGSSTRIDRAIEKVPAINTFLRQDIGERAAFEDTLKDTMRLSA